ncbi:PAS domain S-box protein [Natrinema salifodinae]|uniref:histidine kinase n=1 Tax=Natrinema salifodinae TaxID=1202768 RepID=A0A1I0N754_9EURY|nr:PAS domain S-box protein [Natrinema salifodinae]SEV96628.1 PAS domain S-box-containing protein [Natrinema salifodinae]
MTERPESTGPTPWRVGDERAARRWFRTLVDTVPGGVFQLDADDRVVAIDETLLEATGYDRETLRGEHVSALVGDGALEALAPDTSAGRGLAASDAETETHPDRVGALSIESTVRTANGTDRSCELRLERVPGPTADGRRGSIGIVRNLDVRESGPTTESESERAGGAEAEPEAVPTPSFESIAAVLEEADVGVFVLDDAFDVAWINDAAERYFGLDRTAVVGRDNRQVIEETIGERIAEPDRFADIVTATYEDNSGAERFECRVTSGDGRAERRLEHRSKPIESGPYAGGRVELYYDVTDQHHRAYQLRRLNEAVREWLTTGSREAVADQACRHLTDILDLEINGVFLHDPETDALEPVAWSEPAAALFDDIPTFGSDEGVAWRVFDSGEPVIYDDVTTAADVYNPDTPVRSEICLPIGDHGVVLIGSEERNAFDDGDRSLARIVASSLEATFDRLHHERTLERERTQTEALLQTAPVAISVENADGEPVSANRHAQSSLGLGDREPLGETELLAELDVVDADGDSLDPEDGPSARVRATGEPVYGEELAIEGLDGERTWFSITAVPVFGPDGGLERVISAGEDVTALKEHERRLERRKHELETELSEILGRVSDAFYALDDEWRFTHVNDRAAEIMQRSETELLGRSFWDVYEDDSDGRVRAAFHEAMETQEGVTVETDAASLDAWLEFTAYPSETGLSVYFRDVTERKERERALAKYEALVETIEDGIYALDADGRFTTVNRAYADLTGYDREELLGAHASLVVDEEAMELARELATDQTDVSTVETELRTNGGDRVPVETTVTTLSTPGGERERIGVVRDVTERRERQRRLEESEQRYRTLAENFPDGIVALFDDELRYTAAGGQLLDDLDVERDAVLGQTIHERYSDDLLSEIEPHFRAAIDGEERTFEVTHCDRELRAHTLPIRTGEAVSAGMLVVQDITERTEYQRRLEESNERLEQFAYAASHDLQEPLRMISSYLSLIESRYADDLDDDGEEFIEYAVDGADRMREMIDGLLAYSRIETQGEPFEPVDLDDIVADVREDLQFRIEETDAELTIDDLPRVEGDPSQFRQVFQNLLSNAIEYCGDDPPHVRVTAERQGRTWKLSVADEGIGIDPDQQDRIFEVFQRLHGREEYDGTGIGLALCRRIVERHDGEIRVDSEPGEGATFSFTLPAAD